jgi:uncharacterized protein (TIGR02996 family)
MFDDAERGFVREILADPEAAAPRYRYADWLEQQSDPRAEAVRVGVERMAKQWERMFDLEVDLRLEELERRQKNMNVDYSRKVLEQLPQIPGVKWGKFEGGVIELVNITHEKSFRQHAGEILDVQPIYQLLYSGGLTDEALPDLLGSPELARLGALQMGGNYDGPGVARVLADSPHIANLRSLNLGYTEIGEEGAKHLAAAPHLEKLRYVVLTRNALGEAGLRALCEAPPFSQVERLILQKNDLGPNAAAVLAESVFANVRWLDLSDNALGAAGLNALIDSGRLEQIEWLNLGWCELTTDAVAAIFANDNGAELQRVNLRGNPVGAKACTALASNALPALRDLRLELEGNISKKAAEGFAGAAWWPHLEKIYLMLNGASWPSLAPYLTQSNMESLIQLHLVGEADKKTSAATYDELLERLSKNPTLGNLRLLELHMPITKKSLNALSTFTGLKRLMIPGSLKPESARLKKMLPDCKVEFTTYSI